MIRTVFRKPTTAAALATLALTSGLLSAAPASAASLTAFSFESLTSRNPDFDHSPYLYPSNHARGNAGEVNYDTGDIRLDGVVINGVTYNQSQLQLVTGANIVLETGVDVNRGGANLATGHGIGAAVDNWAGQGIGTTTPTNADLVSALGNYNLTSIVATRENPGTTIYEVSFDNPTHSLLLWERGNSGDVFVEALNSNGDVIASLLILDGSNDNGAPSTWIPTGIWATTYVYDTFQNQGQQLSSVGLYVDEAVNTFRFTSHHLIDVNGEPQRYNGPDLKILALDDAQITNAVPEPATAALGFLSLGGLALATRRRRTQQA
jgi:hypothetical protein